MMANLFLNFNGSTDCRHVAMQDPQEPDDPIRIVCAWCETTGVVVPVERIPEVIDHIRIYAAGVTVDMAGLN